MKHILLLTLSTLIISCSNDDRYDHVYNTYGVNKPTKVELDISVEKLYSEEFEIFSSNSLNDDIGNGEVIGVIGDSISFVVEPNFRIKKVDLSSKRIELEFSAFGNGPGEYQKVNDIQTTDSSLVVIDMETSRVIEYDTQFNHIREWRLPNVNISLHGSRIELNDGKLIYPIANGNMLLSKVELSKNNEISKINEFHERLIPVGKQPKDYNEFIARIMGDKILVISTRFPIFFIYNSTHELESVIKLELEGLDKFEWDNNKKKSPSSGTEMSADQKVIINPKPEILPGSTNIRLNGYYVWDAIYAENKIVMYHSNRYSESRYLIVLEHTGDSWSHSGSYSFIKDDGDIFSVTDLSYDNSWLYLGGLFERDIIRVKLSEL